MQRIGIYGGTYNPPHLGHIRAAKFAVEALGLQKMLMIPSCISPHKSVLPENSATAVQRLEMLRLALQGEPDLQASDLEIARGGQSYTYQTVLQLREQYPEQELVLFMGTDMFLYFDQWKNPACILQNASLAVFYRGQSGEAEKIEQCRQKMVQQGAKVYVVKNPVTMISSTDLRRMLVFRCGESFLPESVARYIHENGLYGADRDYRNLPMEQLEPVVTGLLKPNRVAHVLGVRDTAIQLARRWGADETDAARAGLLHDITKALDGPLQLTLCRDYGIILDNFSTQNPKTLHALTGSLVARRVFGENEAVVEAIRSHTTGVPYMNTLQKLVYVADYMEPNRDFPGVERLRELAFADLDSALQLGLEMTISMLHEQKRSVSPESAETLAWLKEKKNIP